MNKNLNKNGDLTFPALFMMGGALFSMHFGASSMVWPVQWGADSGNSFVMVFLGAFITAIALVLVGYVALAKGEGSFNKITNAALGSKLGKFYTCITIIILGPLYAIPRMSAAAWDAIVQAFGLDAGNKLPLYLFTAVFYIVTYFFLMNPGKTMDRISALLFPILIVIVFFVIGKGILSPVGTPGAKSYDQSALAYGFTNGYAVAEILCALIFGIVIVNSLKNKGVAPDHLNKNIFRVGLVGLGMLSLTHLGHMYIGACSSNLYGDIQYTARYTAIAADLLGTIGGILFSIALFFAALTTAIGMTAGCAEFFVDTFENKVEYKRISIIILVLSTLFGCMGLANILTILGPILDGVTPAAIVLVIYYAAMPNCNDPHSLNVCKLGMITAMVFGLTDVIYAYGIKFDLNLGIFNTVYRALPLSAEKLAWIPWTIVACAIGWFAYRKNEVVVE